MTPAMPKAAPMTSLAGSRCRSSSPGARRDLAAGHRQCAHLSGLCTRLPTLSRRAANHCLHHRRGRRARDPLALGRADTSPPSHEHRTAIADGKQHNDWLNAFQQRHRPPVETTGSLLLLYEARKAHQAALLQTLAAALDGLADPGGQRIVAPARVTTLNSLAVPRLDGRSLVTAFSLGARFVVRQTAGRRGCKPVCSVPWRPTGSRFSRGSTG